MSALDANGHVIGKPVSRSTYTNHGCRCAGCRREQMLYNRGLMRELARVAVRDANGHVIGKPVSRSTYTNHGCRCAGCTAINRAEHRRRRREVAS